MTTSHKADLYGDDEHFGTEHERLIDDHQKREPESDPIESGYKTLKALDIKTTLVHWLIGPVVFIYIFGMISSFYLLTEYTNQYTKKDEYAKANLSISNTTDAFCNVNDTDIVYKTETKATAAASQWNVYYSLAGGVPAVISNLFLGAYTDAFGRKFLLAVGMIGTCTRLIIQAVVIYLELDLIYLLIACFIEGITGQYATILQTSLAYVADITKPGKWRIFGIIYIEFVIGIGLSSASFLTGFMIEWIGYIYSMAIAAGILVLDLVFTMVVLPETFGKEHRRKDKSVIGVIKSVADFFVKDDGENKRWKYQLVFLIHAVCNLSFLSRIPVETIYQLASPFCWGPSRVGVYAAIRTIGMMFVGLGSVKVLQKFMDEIQLCMLGVASYAACFYWTAFAKDDLTLYLIIAVGCFGPISTTMQRSILSHLTPPEKQGAIFTTVGVLEVLTTLISMVSTSSIYSATVSVMPGLVFIILGSYDALCLVLLAILKIGWQLEKRRNGYKPIKETVITVGGAQ